MSWTLRSGKTSKFEGKGEKKESKFDKPRPLSPRVLIKTRTDFNPDPTLSPSASAPSLSGESKSLQKLAACASPITEPLKRTYKRSKGRPHRKKPLLKTPPKLPRLPVTPQKEVRKFLLKSPELLDEPLESSDSESPKVSPEKSEFLDPKSESHTDDLIPTFLFGFEKSDLNPGQINENIIENYNFEFRVEQINLDQQDNRVILDDPLAIAEEGPELEIEPLHEPELNRVNNMANAAVLKPDTFYGLSTEDGIEFMRKFKLYCEIHDLALIEGNNAADYNTADAVRRFKVCISGDCAQWVSTLDPNIRWPALEQAFRAEYCNLGNSWSEKC